MNFHILTLFPEMVMNGLLTSITGRAVKQNKIGIEAVNIRDFTEDKNGRVDDYPYGGGAGMLMQAQPVYDACQSVLEKLPAQAKRRVIYVTPQGEPFSQKKAKELSECDELLILCGHYEGIDERVLEEVVTDYVSIGDYVLTGGELAAMVMVDAVARLVPSVLHNDQSAETESFHGNLLEYPQYSRPEVWHGREVPAVLLSGNRKKIEVWRRGQAALRTKERRPDLYEKYRVLEECKAFLMKQKLLHIDMIECINRCRGEVLYWDGKEMLLRETESGVFFHTKIFHPQELPKDFGGQIYSRRKADRGEAASHEEYGNKAVPEEAEREQPDYEISQEVVDIVSKQGRKAPICLVLHQQELVPEVERRLDLRNSVTCLQAVCTRRERLPVRGLYRADILETMLGFRIRTLEMEHLPYVTANYDGELPQAYFRQRIKAGQMKGAFDGEQLAGFIGLHDEGSIGMLWIVPEHRRKKLGQALETVMVNEGLERGEIPYGQVRLGNEPSIALQKKLGLCLSKTPVYWMESK